MAHKLTDKQERFIHEYMLDQNASAAALRAGYAAKSHGVQAAELMRHPLVRAAIRAGLAALYAELKVTARSLLRARAREAFFDPRKMFDAAGRPIPLQALDEETAGALLVSYVTRADGEVVLRVRQPARHAALAALEKRYAEFLRMETVEMAQAAAVEAPLDEAAPVERPPARPLPDFITKRAPRMPADEEQAGQPPAAQWPGAAPLAPAGRGAAAGDARESTRGGEAYSTPATAPRASAANATDSSAPDPGASATSAGITGNVAAAQPAAPVSLKNDPNWMWGGTPRPKPAPVRAPEPPTSAALPRNFVLRAGAVVPMAGEPPAHWPRRDRPQSAQSGPVFDE